RTGSDDLAPRHKTPVARFNPRSRTGSDLRVTTMSNSDRVSIHAPARGATYCASFWMASGRVSIHAPARGATKTHPGTGQFRHVSIHAPARGATTGREWCGR